MSGVTLIFNEEINMTDNEKDKKARTSITIDKNVLERAKELCDKMDMSFSAFVEAAVSAKNESHCE